MNASPLIHAPIKRSSATGPAISAKSSPIQQTIKGMQDNGGRTHRTITIRKGHQGLIRQSVRLIRRWRDIAETAFVLGRRAKSGCGGRDSSAPRNGRRP